MKLSITTPLTGDVIRTLKAGDTVEVSGIIYTGRDAAHKRMCEALERGEKLPFDVTDQIIYYVGPCPAAPGEIIGSCGPTTSYRMDAYTPQILRLGLKGMIGKGKRSDEVMEACIKYGAVYFGAIGGAGALLANHVISSEVVAYEDLGTEAIRRLRVKKFPLTVILDTYGNNLYETGKNNYRTDK